jgi:hypothetical protein
MDVVVTVPKWFGLKQWIDEGDSAGSKWSGQLWDFYCGGGKPNISIGERVYIVCEDKLRGYSPLVKLIWNGSRGSFIRAGDAVAVTLNSNVRGFQGWRYRWWEYKDEIPFPDWKVSCNGL